MEDNKLDLLQQKKEEITKKRNFFWDSIILSVALFISGLSISNIIAEIFSDENSVVCLIKLDNRDIYTFINSYCHEDLPDVKNFPLVAFLQVVLLVAPHYFWQVIVSSRFDSFLNHAAKVNILRESNTGKYPHHNYTIVNYLKREFVNSRFILISYAVKLFIQFFIVVGCIFANTQLFTNITNMDISFECKIDNQVFDNPVFDNLTLENQGFENMTCVYPRKFIIITLVWIDYTMIVTALIMLIIAFIWLALYNQSKKDNKTITDICYNSCIDPRYYYSLPKKRICTKCLEMKDDFTFLLASLDSGIKRVFNTVLIEEMMFRKLKGHARKFDQGN